MQDWTRSDIKAYVHETLGQHPSFKDGITNETLKKGNRVDKLLEQIIDKAQGVFLWVRPVVEDISNVLTNGFAINFDQLEERLTLTPSKLQDFYQLILDRIPQDWRSKSFVIFEAVLRAQRPLILIQLSVMMASQEENAVEQAHDLLSKFLTERTTYISNTGATLEAAIENAVAKQINGCSAGLLTVERSVEISRSSRTVDNIASHDQTKIAKFSAFNQSKSESSKANSRRVHVLHQSVREFFSTGGHHRLIELQENKAAGHPLSSKDGNMMVLLAFLYWLKVLGSLRQKFCEHLSKSEDFLFDVDALFWHARQAELDTNFEYMNLLEEIDHLMSQEHGTTWPKSEPDFHFGGDIHWLYLVAITRDLVHFIEHKVRKDPAIFAQPTRKLLLHTAIIAKACPILGNEEAVSLGWESLDRMIDMLLKYGAEPGQRIDCQPIACHLEKPEYYGTLDALQALAGGSETQNGDERDLKVKIVRSLVDRGADIHHEVTPHHPLLQLIIKSTWSEFILVVKLFAEKGLRIASFNSIGPKWSLLDEALFMIGNLEYHPKNAPLKASNEDSNSISDNIPISLSKDPGRDRKEVLLDSSMSQLDDWIWLFDHGLRIQAHTVPVLYSPTFQNHVLMTEHCRKSKYYSPAARRSAAQYNPQWRLTDAYLPLPF